MAKKKTTAVSRNVTPRADKLAKLAKVSEGVSKLSALTFNVEITETMPADVFGVIAEEHENMIVLKCRPKSGSSKEGYITINRDSIILQEGTVGSHSRIRCIRDVVTKIKDAQVKVDGHKVTVKTQDGAIMHINTNVPGVKVATVAAEVEGGAAPKKKKKKKK